MIIRKVKSRKPRSLSDWSSDMKNNLFHTIVCNFIFLYYFPQFTIFLSVCLWSKRPLAMFMFFPEKFFLYILCSCVTYFIRNVTGVLLFILLFISPYFIMTVPVFTQYFAESCVWTECLVYVYCYALQWWWYIMQFSQKNTNRNYTIIYNQHKLICMKFQTWQISK